ncbi:MAG: hypothetical protein ACE5GX_12580 [Thermoanaerobaculia bacterium]
MRSVAFLISNTRHHLEMSAPVIRRLAQDDNVDCRLLSLCELRGQVTPVEKLEAEGIRCRRIVPFHIRRGAIARGVSASKETSNRHSKLRALFWHLLLRPRLARLLSPRPDLVVTPNDAAYPYDRIAGWLRSEDVPFLLMQEGIRFELPGVPRRLAYGRGGAAAIAAWGASSSEYFRDLGVSGERVRIVGNPRFDRIPTENESCSAKPEPELLLVTNPIEEQGFCSAAEKLTLVRRFVDGSASVVSEQNLRLTLKLHASESREAYERAIRSSPAAGRLRIVEDQPLFRLLADARAVVIMASTVGLEALLFQKPVGVLEIPGTGYVFDYVSEQAALGLTWSRPMAEQVLDLLNYDSPGASRFLDKHLHRSMSGSSTEAIARVVVDLLQSDHPSLLSHDRA